MSSNVKIGEGGESLEKKIVEVQLLAVGDIEVEPRGCKNSIRPLMLKMLKLAVVMTVVLLLMVFFMTIWTLWMTVDYNIRLKMTP